MKGHYRLGRDFRSVARYSVIHLNEAHLRVILREAPAGERVSQRDVTRMNRENRKPVFKRYESLRRRIARVEIQEKQKALAAQLSEQLQQQ
jgi:hypothetical protein